MELSGPADVWTEELFGPVLAVRRAADAEDAFRLANDSEFGLSAAVFTQDITRMLQAVDHVDVGMLHINSESAGADPHVPFGGAKKSGFGPEGTGPGCARVLHPHHYGLPPWRTARRVTEAVEFYWRPGCPFCIALRSRLRRSRIPVREVNIWEDPDAAARVRAVAGGNETVPTVFIGEHALVNPGIKQITEVVRQAAPELLDRAEAEPVQRRFWPFR